MTRRYSARAAFVIRGLAVIAATWTAIGCALIAAWCRICHHAEQT